MVRSTEFVTVDTSHSHNKVLVILLAGSTGMLIGLLDAKSKVKPFGDDITDCTQEITYFPMTLTAHCERYYDW